MSLEKLIHKYSPNWQIGFISPDWKATCLQHHKVFGSGPWLTVEHQVMDRVIRRGDDPDQTGYESHMELACAYAAWGDKTIEVVQQLSPEPSYYTELNAAHGMLGINHMHMYVDNIRDTILEFREYGLDYDTLGWIQGRLCFAMVDMMKDFGTFIEIYPMTNKTMIGTVQKASEGWDGETDMFRDLMTIMMANQGR
jgi:hypothetical protein